MGVGAHCTGKFADSNLISRRHQPLLRSAKLVVQKSHTNSVACRLGMNSMRAPNRQHPSVFASPHCGCCFHLPYSLNQQIGRIPQLPRQRGVENVGGGQSLMNPTSSRTHVRSHILQESQNIVLRPLLVFMNLPQVELRFPTNRPRIFTRNDPPIRHPFTCQNLDLQPARQLGLLRPDRTHFRTGISGNHATLKVLKRNASHKRQP